MKTAIFKLVALFIILGLVQSSAAYEIEIRQMYGEVGIESLQVESQDIVDDVKTKIQEMLGMPAYVQILLFNGEELDGKRTLADYNIQAGSMLFVTQLY